MFTTDPAARKAAPVCSGVLDYFPDAIFELARLSQVGNDQHNPGKPLHWDRAKSGDEADALVRHLMQRGTADTDGIRHAAKVAWRALAMLQKEIEAERERVPDYVYVVTTVHEAMRTAPAYDAHPGVNPPRTDTGD